MNRRGDWIVAMHEGDTRVVSVGRGATPPTSPATQIPAPGFDVRDAAVDDAGNATFAGADLEHPATIVRAADGAFGPLTVLDDATVYSFGITLGAGPAGHAVAVWPAAGYLRSATRLPGGSFGAPVSSGVAAEGAAPQAIGVDGLGRTITILSPPSVSPASMALAGPARDRQRALWRAGDDQRAGTGRDRPSPCHGERRQRDRQLG